MPSVGTVRVSCTLSDPAALSRVSDGIQHEGSHAVVLTVAEVLQPSPGTRIDALVYDLEPGDAYAVDFVRHVHAARPDWPVWLYYMPHGSVIERVTEVASLLGVWSSPQAAETGQEAEVCIHVRRLLASVPRVRLLRLLEDILRPIPTEVWEFLEISLERRDGEPGNAKVLTQGAGTRGALRHLERACQSAILPGPKRLLDHLILVLITFKALAYNMPLLRAAERAGLSPKVFYELRHRLLGPDASSAALEPRAQFEFALAALAKACEAPWQVVQQLVDQFLGERRA